MKLWKTQIKRTALALCAAALIVPAAQASGRPDDRAVGPRSTDVQQTARPDDRAGIRGVGDTSVALDPAYLRALKIRGEALNRMYGESAYLRALRIRGEALNEMYGVKTSVRPDDRAGIRRIDTLAEAPEQLGIVDLNDRAHFGAYDALGDTQSTTVVRPDDRGGVRGVESTPTIVASPSGFDWGDAGIGALGAFGFSLLLAGGMLLAIHSHQRKQSHKVAVL